MWEEETTQQPHTCWHWVSSGSGCGVQQPLTLLYMLIFSMDSLSQLYTSSPVLVSTQTWIGPVLLCINPFEAPGPAVHAVLKHLCEQILQEMANDQLPRALIFKWVMLTTNSHLCEVVEAYI